METQDGEEGPLVGARKIGGVYYQTQLPPGLPLPSFDERVFAYDGDDLESITYKLATVTVGVMHFEWTDGRLTRQYYTPTA